MNKSAPIIGHKKGDGHLFKGVIKNLGIFITLIKKVPVPFSTRLFSKYHSQSPGRMDNSIFPGEVVS